MIICPHCKTYVADEMTFCTNCGEALEFETVIRPEPTPTKTTLFTAETVRPSRFGVIAKWFAGTAAMTLIAGLALIAVVLIAAFIYQVSNPPIVTKEPETRTVYITATPTSDPRPPEPTPQIAKVEKPKPSPPPPISIDKMREKYDREIPPISDEEQAEKERILREQYERKRAANSAANAMRAANNVPRYVPPPVQTFTAICRDGSKQIVTAYNAGPACMRNGGLMNFYRN